MLVGDRAEVERLAAIAVAGERINQVLDYSKVVAGKMELYRRLST